jgi:hypothetical protein
MRSFRRMEAKRGPAPQGKRRDGASEDAAIRKDRNLKEGCVVRRTIPLSLWWREIGNTRRARGEEQRGMKARPRLETTGPMARVRSASATSDRRGLAFVAGL